MIDNSNEVKLEHVSRGITWQLMCSPSWQVQRIKGCTNPYYGKHWLHLPPTVPTRVCRWTKRNQLGLTPFIPYLETRIMLEGENKGWVRKVAGIHWYVTSCSEVDRIGLCWNLLQLNWPTTSFVNCIKAFIGIILMQEW